MKIHFSRHSKRRIKLYNIKEITVEEIIQENLHINGKNILIKNIENLQYPLKIVYFYENEVITVITAYPLKKRKK